jgi:hypothetical protein
MSGRTINDPAAADRLAKLCGMFGSTHAGERANAAAAADKLVRSAGLTWSEVIALPASPTGNAADWRRMLRFCADRIGWLNEREADFIVNIAAMRRELSPKQAQWLRAIFARLGGGA